MAAPASTISPLTIRLFGPLEIRHHDAPLPRLRSRKSQWLLALLALRPGRDVERAWLAGMLWPDRFESEGLALLRRELTGLRSIFGPEAGRLCSPSGHTLRLDLSDADVDVHAFDAAVARGDEPSLQKAIVLHRGVLLEGCAEEWVVPEREAREQAYLTALETLAAHATGRREMAVAERLLRRVVAVDPLRESAQRGLMQALAAAENPAAATQVYRDCRLLLHRELNAEPAPATTALYHQIRAAAQKGGREGARERESERARERAVGSLPRSLAPSLPHSLPPRHLPQPLTPLVGRDEALREVMGYLATARLVTLTGTGGVGKTRLAIRVAAEVSDDYTDGVFFVELAALSDPALVPRAVASALEVREQPDRPLTASFQDFLRPKQLLLVLDNCEHVSDACAQLAETLLRAGAHVRLLATSRQSLGLTGEVTWRVPSLSLPEDPGVRRQASGVSRDPEMQTANDPSDWRLTPDAWRLLQSEAVRLFVERAAAVAPGFALTQENAAAVVQVCRRMDGIPLAIELAAARVKAMPVGQLPALLDHPFRLLTGGSRTALPRQQTLRATIDWSYHLLTEREQTALRRLSVFAGGCTLAAAEAVCACGVSVECEVLSAKRDAVGPEALTLNTQHLTLPLAEGAVLDLLASLVDKSLVVYEEQHGEARYRLLETLRQYGRERLAESGEAEQVRGRHRDWYLALAEEAERARHQSDRGPWMEKLEREIDDLRAALEWAGEHGEAELELRLAAALAEFWNVSGHWEEGRQWLEGALARTGTGEDPPDGRLTRARALVLSAAGHLATELGDHAAARSRLQESVRLCREIDDRDLLGWSLFLLFYETGESAVGEESVALYRERGNRSELVYPLYCLGNRALQRGDYTAARTRYEESLAIARELGDKAALARPIAGLGALAWELGDYAAARSAYEETVALRREQGDAYLANYLNALGSVLCEQGDEERATALFEESRILAQERGHKRALAGALVGLGSVARRQGDYATAHSLCEQGLEVFQEVGDKWGIAQALTALALVAQAQGDGARARECHAQSLVLASTLGETWGSAASLGPWNKLGNPGYIAECLERLAGLAAAEGHAERAIRWYAAAEARRGDGPRPPADQRDYERIIGAARAALGEEVFATAWAEGCAMPLEEACREAAPDAV